MLFIEQNNDSSKAKGFLKGRSIYAPILYETTARPFKRDIQRPTLSDLKIEFDRKEYYNNVRATFRESENFLLVLPYDIATAARIEAAWVFLPPVKQTKKCVLLMEENIDTAYFLKSDNDAFNGRGEMLPMSMELAIPEEDVTKLNVSKAIKPILQNIKRLYLKRMIDVFGK